VDIFILILLHFILISFSYNLTVITCIHSHTFSFSYIVVFHKFTFSYILFSINSHGFSLWYIFFFHTFSFSWIRIRLHSHTFSLFVTHSHFLEWSCIFIPYIFIPYIFIPIHFHSHTFSFSYNFFSYFHTFSFSYILINTLLVLLHSRVDIVHAYNTCYIYIYCTWLWITRLAMPCWHHELEYMSRPVIRDICTPSLGGVYTPPLQLRGDTPNSMLFFTVFYTPQNFCINTPSFKFLEITLPIIPCHAGNQEVFVVAYTIIVILKRIHIIVNQFTEATMCNIVTVDIDPIRPILIFIVLKYEMLFS